MNQDRKQSHDFTVIDKRNLDPNGEIKPERAGAVASPAAEEAPTGATNSRPLSAMPAPSFSLLILQLAALASYSMGKPAASSTGEHKIDLPAARHGIDMLALLERKTEGNRTVEESELLKQVLMDLRLQYVECARKESLLK